MAHPLEGPAIFVAPHLDDVALSCGGTVARHACAGPRPLIVTVAAGVPDPASSSARDARRAGRRRQEDATAAAILGATTRWLPYLDAVYRGYGRAVFGGSRTEPDLTERIGRDLEQLRRDTGSVSVFLPLGIGDHIDHRLCASLHEPLRRAGADVWHYEDVPYVLRWTALANRIHAAHMALPCRSIAPSLEARFTRMGLVPHVVDVTAHMTRRLAAVACYKSQLAGLFPRHDQNAQIRGYAARLVATHAAAYGERFWTFGP